MKKKNKQNMGMSLPLIIGGVLVILVGGYFVYTNQMTSSESVTADVMSDDEMMQDDGAEGEAMTGENGANDTMMEEEGDHSDDNAMTEGDAMVKGATYTDYKPELLANAEDGKVALFFKADWCPSCRALDSDIEENKADIPDDVTILKVNYDTADELKQKYGVTTQHTIVQVDAEGNMIEKWLGHSSLENVLSELN